MKIKPRNWDNFQQYKDRKPTWIKFHRDLLNDFSYSSVQIGTKATLPLLWLLASEYDDGLIDASIEEISFRIHIDVDTVRKALEELLEKGFFTCEDENVQECTESYKIVPREEKRREEKSVQKRKDPFNLPTAKSFDKLSDEYVEMLKNKIKDHNEELSLKRLNANSPLSDVLTFDEFSNRFLASGKKQKDFWRTFLQYEKYVFEAESKRKGIKC